MGALADFIAPARCAACGDAADGDLCEYCSTALEIIGPPLCRRCGTPGTEAGPCIACRSLTAFGRARSLLVFGGPARRLVLVLKRRGSTSLAADAGRLLADLARREGMDGRTVACVPAGRRARARGFDHAELLARAVGRELGVAFRRSLVRAGDASRQADVSIDRRRANVASAFVSRPVTGAVLLVDDVYTTGATVDAGARALRAAGADRVDVLTLARTLRRHAGPRL